MHTTFEEKKARVDIIVELMQSGEFKPADRKRLAAEWKIAVETMGGYIREASAIVRSQIGDSDEVKARVLTRIDVLGRKAEECGDIRAAITAEDAIATIAGCKPKIGGTTVNVVQTEQFTSLIRVVLEKLDPYPEAKAAVLAGIRDAQARKATRIEEPSKH
jgi:hypothetical protein